MIRFASAMSVLFLATTCFAAGGEPPLPLGPASVLQAHPNLLFNGWKLTPAGRQVGINSLPLKMAISPDGQTLAAVCAGRYEGLALIDLRSEQTRQWFPLPRTFNGLAFSPDGKHIYVSGGNSDTLYVFNFNGKSATAPRTVHLAMPATDAKKGDNVLTGLAVNPTSGKIYLCDEGADRAYVIDPANFAITAHWQTGARPYSCVLGAGGTYLYVSNWGDKSVSAINTTTGETTSKITVGLRPNEMALAPDGRLFVCCAGDNTVHVIQTQTPPDTDLDRRTNQNAPPPQDALEIIGTSLYDSSPEGSTPDAVAVSPDGKSLFVANADNNDVLIADIANPTASRVVGFVPVGWYPTAVASDGKHLFVANGKGIESTPSFPARRPGQAEVVGVKFDPPLGILTGVVSIIDAPSPAQLAAYTNQTRDNSPYTPADLKKNDQPNDSIIPSRIGGECPITHVLYIIKENRTYDQMFGDMTDSSGRHIGNGDPQICMYGQNVSPNQHQLARDYVLMDNLYVNSEVSVDGHAWCDLGISTDFNQREWMTSYMGHGHIAGGPGTGETLNGAIWQDCLRNSVSVKCYGEGEGGVPNSDRGTWHGSRDPERAQGWIQDLHDAEKTGNLAQFMIMSLGENHTAGTSPGAFTPQAMVASNDLAVGMIVYAASHSKFWPQMAIFIVEDDAQNGPDHVDAHRTDGLVISPYVKRHVVDSTHYTQMSMLRTMELILGIPSLTQYDAAGVPMFNLFSKTPDSTPFNLVKPRIDLTARNSKRSPYADASSKMDFDDYDEAPEDELNRILWADAMGMDKPYPTPIHRAVFAE